MARRALVAALAGGVLALSGCATVDSGQAAVSDSFRISQTTVDTQTSEVAQGRGEPPSQPPEGLASSVTQRLVQDALVEARAGQLGYTLTPAQVEKGLADLTTSLGGHDQLVQAALEQNIPESAITQVVRRNLFLQQMSQAVGGTPQEQITALSKELHVQVSPRYGTWDSTTLAIVPGSAVVKSGSTGTSSTQ